MPLRGCQLRGPTRQPGRQRAVRRRAGRLVFAGTSVEWEDTRKYYAERRIVCYGLLAGRLVVVGYTPRGPVRHVSSMRKANDREKNRLAPYFEV